jgi:hypothetical protein
MDDQMYPQSGQEQAAKPCIIVHRTALVCTTLLYYAKVYVSVCTMPAYAGWSMQSYAYIVHGVYQGIRSMPYGQHYTPSANVHSYKYRANNGVWMVWPSVMDGIPLPYFT